MLFSNEDNFSDVLVFCSDYCFELHFLICKIKTTSISPNHACTTQHKAITPTILHIKHILYLGRRKKNLLFQKLLIMSDYSLKALGHPKKLAVFCVNITV